MVSLFLGLDRYIEFHRQAKPHIIYNDEVVEQREHYQEIRARHECLNNLTKGETMNITIRYFEAEITEVQIREIVEPFGEVTNVIISPTKFPDKHSATVEMPIERLQADVIANKIKRIERNNKKLIAFAEVDDNSAVQA